RERENMVACFCLLYMFFNERRFFGESTPFGKKSHKTAEILGYLNSQQALADYAILIRSLKQNLSSEASPVVVFGGSYGGTWYRLKYPHIAIGALASSAPILQFDNIVPLTSFYDAISQDFKDASVNCFKVIKRSWEELDAVSNMKHGLPELSVYRDGDDNELLKREHVPTVRKVTLRKLKNNAESSLDHIGSPQSLAGRVRTMRMDLRAATKGDPEWLKEQRKQEVAIIEKWISDSSFWEGFSQIDSSKICKTGTESDCHLRLLTPPETIVTKVPPSSTPAKENQLGDSASLQAQLDAKATTEKTVPENGSTQQTDSTPNSIPLTVEESPLLQ
ncbi:hypothetical protein HID58_094058, partial [Brassica napus]